MKRSENRMNQITSLLAIAISVVAMLVSILEVSAVREQQRADVWPYIELGQSYSESGFRLQAINKGVGPALVGEVALYRGDTLVETVDQLILDTVGPENAFGYELYGAANISNSVMAAGEENDLFRVPWEDRTRLLIQRWQQGDPIDIRLCYCSIHNDCWNTSLLQQQPEPTDQCT